MSTGSFCSRSNCTATFRRSIRGGVAEDVGGGVGVCAGAEPPLRVSNTRVTVTASLRQVLGLLIACSSPLWTPRRTAVGATISAIAHDFRRSQSQAQSRQHLRPCRTRSWMLRLPSPWGGLDAGVDRGITQDWKV